MSSKRFALSRRTMLRGMASGAAATLALPVLDAMLNEHGTALAQGTPLPKRFGVFFWGNGVRLAKWNPKATGAGYELTEELAGLAKVKEYVSVVSGMDIKTGNERGHHAGTVGILSAAPMISQDPKGAPYASTFSAPSIDQVVAAELGGATKFRSLELGVSRRIVSGEGTSLRYLSHNGPDNANPPEYSPRALFTRVFGTGFMGGGATPTVDPRLMLRRSVLDAIRLDANALRTRLGTNDRVRLDQHLESIRALEQQIASAEMAAPPPSLCMAPSAPTDPQANDITGVSDLMSELLTLSLACDQTRVFSIMFSGSVSLQVYSEVGATTEHHGLSHDEPGDQPTVHKITTFIINKFATLLEKLKNTTEGDGNLLDRCAILASSDTAEGQPHSIGDYPILVAGKAGGALVHPGVHYRSASKENTSKVLLTLLQAMDLKVTEYGKAGGMTNQTVDALKP
ncbi:MAG TPA: DUF1552 domain-containing protein [Polyangiales bacterium]|nr:DUF1552 domain-containing protein [Polyangiales bacterium]